MQLINLPLGWTLLIDFFAWFLIHIGMAALALALPDRLFAADRGWFKTRGWEHGGRIWQQAFRVKSWKARLPDGARIARRGFAKRNLKTADPAYLRQFILESRRAEFTHALGILPAFLFFFWNPAAAGWLMLVYAIAANGPCLIAQRYNRPRLQKLLAQIEPAARGQESQVHDHEL
jgi:glycosyl-4,4'-diaponeurosporenoate acyltransferase